MSSDAGPAWEPETDVEELTIGCQACEQALRTGGPSDRSVLLLDTLRVPLIGCADHRDQFASTCGLTTTTEPELLQHRPAGGLGCPSCQLAMTRPVHPVVPVGDGAVSVLGCQDHQTAAIDRYQDGLAMAEHLSASLPSA